MKMALFIKISISILILISVPFQAHSEDPKDAAVNKEATQKTQELLKNPAMRKEATKSGAAKAADDAVSTLSGGDPQIIQKIYELAADVFPMLVSEGHADPKEMQSRLEKMSKNPGEFANKFTPEQLKKLHEISVLLEPKNKPKN